MSFWEGNSATYRQRPTWHYESTNWFTVQRIDTLGFYGLRHIAKDHYDWLKTRPGGPTYNGHCMVAAFWDPVTRTVFASSIPLGPRKGEMVAASLNNHAAPYWYSQVYTLNYETSTENNGPYPSGSMIAIYDKFLSLILFKNVRWMLTGTFLTDITCEKIMSLASGWGCDE